jgi:23S rRNA pseudouridine2605 synthase
MLSENKTLLRLLIDSGFGSRREVAALILQGRISVNGTTVDNLKFPVSGKDLVALDGKPARLESRQSVVLLMNKPEGVLSTTSDERGRKTVVDLLPDKYRRLGLYPAGRLDKDTTGLLLLTNDGELTYKITHPKFEFEKEYLVSIKDELTPEERQRLEQGIRIEEGITSPAVVKKIAGTTLYNYSITLHEGKKRQVRRMFEALGHPVSSLKRARVGSLTLGNLKEGEVRELTSSEINKIVPGSNK